MTNKQDLIKVCVDFARNPEQVLSIAQSEGKNFDEQLRSKFFNLLGIEEGSRITRRTLSKTSTKELVFEIITEAIEEGFAKGVEEDEFFMQFADTRFLARGDKNEFYLEDDATLIVSEHSGNHWNIRRQKYEGGQIFGVDVKAYAIGVYGDFEAFMTGRASFQKLINKGIDGLKQKVYEVVAASFADAKNSLPTTFVQSGTYAEGKLIELFDHVKAANGADAIVVGSKKALANVANDVTWYSEKMKDARNTEGRIGEYLGMTLVELPVVHKAGTFDFAYDQDVLYVLSNNGDKFIKLTIEGDDLVKVEDDPTAQIDMAFDYKHISRFGAAVVFSTLVGFYELA
ncbi:hypothetical protein M3649_04155 [Ureibacillus chungkukjangi]|uniref:hypothetical protein n=1 Tax=Ureibacillus chungkukjangi TaxID=1202712 RepID=UPI00203F4772|nr:hypothetical protein [Ureibacillus chungkukjangi]MCM3387326.1 hypothetical protein [Ureibacillus chungkukjangi]